MFGLQTKRHLGGLIECRPLTVLLVKHDKQLLVDDSDFGVIPSTRSQQVPIQILEVMTKVKYSQHELPTSARKSPKIRGRGIKPEKFQVLTDQIGSRIS